MNYHSKGALPKKVDLRDYKIASSSIREEFPNHFSLWTPPAKDQGVVNSCVAHVSAEIEEYYNHKEGHTFFPLAPGYVYGCRYDYMGEGMYLRDALKTLKNRGVCTKEEFKYNKEVPEIISLFEEKEKEGFKTDEQNTINSYFGIDCNNEKALKHCLMTYGPIMASIPWYDNFFCEDNGVLQGLPIGDYGYHCVYIYGWNENGWLILNSWGKDWGNNGSFIYPYNYEISEAWGIIDTEDKLKDIVYKEKRPQVMDLLYKIVNFCINLFNGKI